MKAATAKEIKDELKLRSESELLDLCLHLSRFKKENKELLTYLLFESGNEAAYIESVKQEVVLGLEDINIKNYYWVKKSIRKVLRMIKKYVRYSKKKETEVELLLFFCAEILKIRPDIRKNAALENLYQRQIASIKKSISTLHEDLQYDYTNELEGLESN